ncbi:MAG: ZIP family zinc transporter [Gammaproteobacteria bacterium]|nr:ZIP family zinc transporter [Gammaproteobacteria bacterium]
MSPGLEAAFWGGFAGLALLLGAAIGYFVKLPHKVVASIMAFGAGVLISILSFELMETATHKGGLLSAIMGFSFGVIIYSGANAVLSLYGAKHRKRSQVPGSHSAQGAGTAIVLGAIIDGVPEAAAIGVSLLDGEGVALLTVFAIFLSNIPEGLSSSAGMRASGKSARYVFGLWFSIAGVCAMSAWLGFRFLGLFGDTYVAFATAVAAGAILVMVIQTMVPEAFEDIHNITGPIAAAGFLTVYSASVLLG